MNNTSDTFDFSREPENILVILKKIIELQKQRSVLLSEYQNRNPSFFRVWTKSGRNDIDTEIKMARNLKAMDKEIKLLMEAIMYDPSASPELKMYLAPKCARC